MKCYLNVTKKYFYQYLWDIAKNLMRSECLVLNAHRKQSQRINYLNIHIKTLEKHRK